jgi:hypothetical protein
VAEQEQVRVAEFQRQEETTVADWAQLHTLEQVAAELTRCPDFHAVMQLADQWRALAEDAK